LNDVDMLVGGDVPKPWEDTGECSGDGDTLRYPALVGLGLVVHFWTLSLLGRLSFVSAFSAFTTSANEMKLKRRTSFGSVFWIVGGSSSIFAVCTPSEQGDCGGCSGEAAQPTAG
jgi:hypothetical protein